LGLTFGELVDAAKAAQSDRWDHTSHLLALIYNVNTDGKSRRLKPEDFHPLHIRAPRGSNYTADKVSAEFKALAATTAVQRLTISASQVIE
jgi:hypothetical protein